MQKIVFPIDLPGTGTVAVPVSVPIPAGVWGIVERIVIRPNSALVSIPAFSVTDVPANLLRRFLINRLVGPGMTLNFSVRFASGTGDVTGQIIGMREP